MHHVEAGTGPPLILLHGIGMSHVVWEPVMDRLGASRRVIAFDLPGFGASPPLPAATPPTPGALVDALDRSLGELKLTDPIDVVGNSLGGLLALEMARRGRASRVVAISPAGLWRGRRPRRIACVLKTLRFACVRLPAVVKASLRAEIGREILLAVPLSPGSRRMSWAQACRVVDDLGGGSAFEAIADHTTAPFDGRDIRVPVTVAFGTRDAILTRRAQRRDALPAHTRWIERAGWGHVPMWSDPDGVARLILDPTG